MRAERPVPDALVARVPRAPMPARGAKTECRCVFVDCPNGRRGRGDEVEDVSSWELDDEEWLGDQEKFWLSEPTGSMRDTGPRWLFKPSRRVTLEGRGDAPPREFTWFDAQSELIVCKHAQLVGVPSASIRLAQWNDEYGCISRDVRRENEDLHSGDTYLSGLRLPGYVPNAQRSRNRTGHHLEAIELVLAEVPGPVRDSSLDALAVFAGYLTLDAWIGNSDRHGSGTRTVMQRTGRSQLTGAHPV